MDNLSGICYNDNIDGGMSGDESNTSSTRSGKNGSNGNSRRKMSRWDQSEQNRSHGSLLSTMERFVQTVDDMNETILVPCRLMDMKFDQQSQQTELTVSGLSGSGNGVESKRLMQNLNGVDLFQFYSVLNSVRNDLMWGQTDKSSGQINGSVQPPQSQPAEVKGHARRPSTVSTASSASASDIEFSELNEDSGVEGEEEYSQHMADSFRHHLSGLQQCLRDLSIAADYVTTRYNTDLGGVNI